MINWRVRVRNANFWASLLPLILLTMQNMARVFGYEIDLGDKTDEIMAAVTPLLSVLALMGIVNDPTVATWSDSPRALAYTEPYRRDMNDDGKVDERDVDILLEKIKDSGTWVPKV